jgi:hypothetical protein
MGGTPPVALSIALNPLIFSKISVPNLDWMVALGALMPHQIGLFLILAKPQIGAGLAIIWILQAWRNKSLRSAVRLAAPVTFVFLASFLVYGPYLLGSARLIDAYYNWTIWPYGLPVGLFMLYLAFSRSRPWLALSAAPFLSPYFPPYSWIFLPLGLLPNQRLALLSTAILSLMFVAVRFVFV